MNHAKRLCILQWAWVSFASKSWCQKEIANKTNEDEKILEIKIEKVCQHKFSWKIMVVHAEMDKEDEISKN